MNPNIALSGRRPKFNALSDMAAAGQIHGQQMQASNNALQMKRTHQGMQREDQLRTALQSARTPAEISSAYQSVGDAAGMMKTQEHGLKTREYDQKFSTGELDIAIKQAEGLQKAAGLAQSPAGYPTALAVMEQIKPGSTAQLSPEWNQGAADTLLQLSLSGAEAIKAQQDAIGKTKVYPPEVAAQRTAERAAGASTNKVTVSAGDTESQKLRAKRYDAMYSTYQNANKSAQSLLGQYKRIDRLIGDDYSGAGAEQYLWVQKAARGLGIDLGDTSGKEAAQAVSNKLALSLRSTDDGGGMPGAMSDKDRQFLVGMTPGLLMSNEGRQVMIKVQEVAAKRARIFAKEARDYERKHGGLDSNFEEMMAQKYENVNFFEEFYGDAGATPELLTGKVYTDGDGNRATWNGTGWDEF